jgi:hypothetical protein
MFLFQNIPETSESSIRYELRVRFEVLIATGTKITVLLDVVSSVYGRYRPTFQMDLLSPSLVST